VIGSLSGIIGGLGGIGGAVLSFGLGVVGVFLKIPGSLSCLSDASWLLLLAFLGLLGGIIAISRPKIGGLMQMVAAFLGLFIARLLWIFPFILFVFGALALFFPVKLKEERLKSFIGRNPVQSYWYKPR